MSTKIIKGSLKYWSLVALLLDKEEKMSGVLEICECGRKFLRGIYPQKKCHVCDAITSSIYSKPAPKPARTPLKKRR